MAIRPGIVLQKAELDEEDRAPTPTSLGKMQPELYAAYMLKEDFLNIWQGPAKSFSEDRFDVWIQRAMRHSNLQLDTLVSMVLSHRRQILAFSTVPFSRGLL